MKNIEIKIFKETRMVELNKFIIGNDGENLQGNLVFTFDEFVDGQARLEYVIDGKKNYIVLEKVGKTYQVPILSVITKKGQIDMQVVVTQGTEDIAIFKSNLFYLTCNASINAEIEQPDEYLQWIEVANSKLNEVDNIDIDAVKENGVATITITKKDGTQQSVNLFDAEGAVTNYELLENLPSINGVELTGDKSLDELNIQKKGDYLTSETDPLFKQSASYDITSQDIQNWNNKSEFSGNYDDLNGKPTIPTKTSQLTNDSGYINEHQDISGKQDKLISGETIKTINNQSLLGSGNITITSENGTTDYDALDNRPSINNIVLSGNKTLEELGIQEKGDYLKENDLQDVLQDYAKSDEIPDISGKQDKLVSGTNIKTINGNSILGSGNITIEGGSGSGNGSGEVGIVLFESTEEYGNNGTVELLDNVRNYKYIDITFGLNTTKEISRIDATSQTFALSRMLSVNTMLFFRNTTYNLLDTSITVKDYSSIYTNDEKQVINERPTSSVLGIFKVVGYK